MQFHPDTPPAFRTSRNIAENQNEKNMIQAALMGRSPGDPMDWSKRYSRVFRELFNQDGFYELVKEAHLESDAKRKNEMLTHIQQMLDDELEKDPTKVDDYGEPQG